MGYYSELVTFHDATTTPKDGFEINTDVFNTVAVEIYGTSASRTVNFWVKGPAGVKRAIQGARLSDLSLQSSTTGTGEIWTFDTTAIDVLIMEVAAVAGGNVTIKGRATV